MLNINNAGFWLRLRWWCVRRLVGRRSVMINVSVDWPSNTVEMCYTPSLLCNCEFLGTEVKPTDMTLVYH